MIYNKLWVLDDFNLMDKQREAALKLVFSDAWSGRPHVSTVCLLLLLQTWRQTRDNEGV